MNHLKRNSNDYNFWRKVINICGSISLVAFLAVFAAAQQDRQPPPGNQVTAQPSDQSDSDEKPINKDKEALYIKFISCYKDPDWKQRDACYVIAKEYLDKYEKDNDQYSAFVRRRYDQYNPKPDTGGEIGRFDSLVKMFNIAEIFSSGKKIIATNPDLIDVPIVLASVGFEQASANSPNDKYNNEAIEYSKMVIDKINAGKTCDQCGAYEYIYKTRKYPDGVANVLGFMNYYIGYIMYNRQNMKKEALPYLYKATQAKSETKVTAEVYRIIGSWYADEFLRLDDDRLTKIKAPGDHDTEETKSIFALEKSYAERAADASVRAYNFAGPAASNRNELLRRAKEFYGVRFYNDPAKTKGFENFAAAALNKPFADPTTFSGN